MQIRVDSCGFVWIRVDSCGFARREKLFKTVFVHLPVTTVHHPSSEKEKVYAGMFCKTTMNVFLPFLHWVKTT